MARVFLRCVADSQTPPRQEDLVPKQRLIESAAADSRRRHAVVADPASADVVLFAESHDDDAASGPYFDRVLSDEVYRRFPGKCFIHSGLDRTVPMLPGVYPSLERCWAWKGWTRSGCYLAQRHPYLPDVPIGLTTPKQFLASFVGSCATIAVRHRLLALSQNRGLCIQNAGPEFVAALRRNDQIALEAMKRHYIQVIAQSSFALCPRGAGTGSMRLFEAMELGVTPVIISDDWEPPVGPCWQEFSLRVPENETHRLPDLLRQHESKAADMGAAARREWESHYAPSTLFDTVIEDCLALARARALPMPIMRARARLQMLRPTHAVRLAKSSRFAAMVRSWRGR